MKRYTMSQARESLAEVLNEAERGGGVVIERRNVEYEIRPRRMGRRASVTPSLIETLDAAVAAGQWSWEWKPDGLKLRTSRRRSWLDQGHARTRALTRRAGRLYVSPASLLELEFLLEAGRIRLRGGTLEDVASSARWLVDEPPSIAWFQRAVALSWTRDPFDRLIAAHAQLRGWKLATADRPLLERLPQGACLEI